MFRNLKNVFFFFFFFFQNLNLKIFFQISKSEKNLKISKSENISQNLKYERKIKTEKKSMTYFFFSTNFFFRKYVWDFFFQKTISSFFSFDFHLENIWQCDLRFLWPPNPSFVVYRLHILCDIKQNIIWVCVKTLNE